LPRANVSVDKTIFDHFAAQAALEGKTLYALTNEWLDAAVKISAEGGNSRDVSRVWRSTAALRQVDVIVLPSDFVDEMIAKLYATDRAGLMAAFSALGTNLVGIFKIATHDIDGLSDLAKDFTIFIPIKRFEINKNDGNSVEVSIVGAGKKIESTECSFEFIKALLRGYGYDVTSNELSVGTIRLKATKRSTI
jgi:hypothetical protein